MTPEQAAALKVGDIVEFESDCCYWLAKLTELKKDTAGVSYWKTVNHGKTAAGVTASSILQYPENVTLVGHSNSPGPLDK